MSIILNMISDTNDKSAEHLRQKIEPRLSVVNDKIVLLVLQKPHGLPLAAVAMGTATCGKPKAWRKPAWPVPMMAMGCGLTLGVTTISLLA